MSEVSPLVGIFTHTYLHVAENVFDHLNCETFLALRLVCKDWRALVNMYKPKWRKINQTCIIDAARAGHQNMVEVLIAKGVDVNTEMQRDQVRETALHKASRLGHASIVEVLVTSGAQLNKVNRYGETALHMASLMGRTSAVSVLLAHGADVDGVWKIGIDSPPVGACHRQMYSPTMAPLVMASMQGHLEVVKLLVEYGADIKIQDNLAVQHARRNGHTQVEEFLLAELRKKGY